MSIFLGEERSRSQSGTVQGMRGAPRGPGVAWPGAMPGARRPATSVCWRSEHGLLGLRQTKLFASWPIACWLCDPWQITLLCFCFFIFAGGPRPRPHGLVVGLDEVTTWRGQLTAHARRVQAR